MSVPGNVVTTELNCLVVWLNNPAFFIIRHKARNRFPLISCSKVLLTTHKVSGIRYKGSKKYCIVQIYVSTRLI